MRALTVAAAACGLLLTIAGAVGAHLIAGGTDPFPSVEAVESMWIFPVERWNSALLYGFVHTLAALIAVRTLAPGKIRYVAGWAFLAGVILFSGVQIATLVWAGMTSGAAPLDNPFETPPTPFDALSGLVPAGGLAFMAGWIALGAAAILAPRDHA